MQPFPIDYRQITLSSFLKATLKRLSDLEIGSNKNVNIIKHHGIPSVKGRLVETSQHKVVGYIEKIWKTPSFFGNFSGYGEGS